MVRGARFDFDFSFLDLSQGMSSARWDEHLRANNHCADCGSVDGVTWASRAYGITLCIHCSGAHRGLGESKVASLTLDQWSAEQKDAFMNLGGNATANNGVLARTPHVPLDENSSAALRNHFVACKWTGIEYRPDSVVAASAPEAKRSPRHVFGRHHHHEAKSGAPTHITNTNAGVLRILLIHGRHLKAADVTGRSDPYCVFGVGRFAEKELTEKASSCISRVIRQSLEPEWNETLMLNVPSLDGAVLTVQVWDFDPPPKHHDNLGVAHVDLHDIDQHGEPLELALPLSKKGFIRLKLSFTRL